MKALGKFFAGAGLMIALVNAFGGVVAGVWFAFAGDWSAIGWGIVWLFVCPYAASLIVLPAMLIGSSGVAEEERGNVATARLFGALGGLFLAGGIVLLSLLVTAFFFGKIRETPLLPTLLWTYGAAVAPWAFLASKEDNEYSGITVLFLQLGYLVGAVLVLISRNSLVALTWSLIIAMLGNWVFQQYVLGETLSGPRRK